ncbi:MAG: hypothetical protein J6P87_00985 [Lachnospiraceae bacterium]|nr:hypothetical protein [Lachnospiraceae bacterium]
MRRIVFKMEREGLLKEGDHVTVSEGILPGSYYYTIEPALAMSGNFRVFERLATLEGDVEMIEKNDRGFYVTVVFDEDGH